MIIYMRQSNLLHCLRKKPIVLWFLIPNFMPEVMM